MSWAASVWSRRRASFVILLYLPTDEDLHHVPLNALPRRFSQAQTSHPQVGCPLPHLVAREAHQVEGLNVAIRGLWRVVLYPHQRGRQGAVADHLRGELLGAVGHRGAVVGGKVDVHAASSAAGGGMDV